MKIIVLCATIALALAQGTREFCGDPNNRVSYSSVTDYGNSISCDEYYSPYCLKTDPTDQGSGGICTSCAIEGSIPGLGTGGSCMCDARTQTCNLQGRCVDYTLLGRSCSSDGECRRSQTAANGRRDVVEGLFCVKSVCKPCSPDAWDEFVGPVGVANITCGGFNEALSQKLGRYAMESVLPGVSFTCNADGDIVYLDFGSGVSSPAPDWEFGCEGCDPDTWQPARTIDTSLSSTSSSSSTSGNTTTSATGRFAAVSLIILWIAIFVCF